MSPDAVSGDFPARHDLVWLRPMWREALRGAVAPSALDALGDWFGRRLPAVACRRDGSCGDAIPLAVALPSSAAGEKRRVALAVEPRAVERIGAPATLREAAGSAPPAWRERLGALDHAARDAGLVLRVYGSLAWQHLSGRAYVTERSDVDLLVEPRSAGELRGALALLRARGDGIPRLDGEVLLPGGRGVSWRELAAGAARVLVKSGTAVALEPARALLGPLAGEEPWP
ncbi:MULTISPECIES: malonate decarboxylase holo-[acyl-carrier-protein] synthase [Anaeromyxobacter]|uniref:malonate decarboxylase holo-[acyl-carrier-protein] synthase n=1 Tax=Anaeromyxobacter TaxID=161492 RepID=UPI001F58771C|nr:MULTISPECIES: malonate decarboxylase holo-[acyl-carrier-protein] synthase [unclassified Anaeromyxobacter]